MSASSRRLACAAYLLILPGALAVLLLRRDDSFASYHARHSLMIVASAVASPLLWAICAWLLAWVPLVGPMLAVALFTLVLATETWLVIGWAMGLIYALQGRTRHLPLIWWRARSTTERSPPAVEVAVERAEKAQASDA